MIRSVAQPNALPVATPCGAGWPRPNRSKWSARGVGSYFYITIVIFIVSAGGCTELVEDNDHWDASSTTFEGIFALDEKLISSIPNEFLADIELRDAYLRGYFVGVQVAFDIYPKPGEIIWEIELGNDPPLLGDQEIDGKYRAEAQGRRDGYSAAKAMFDRVTGRTEHGTGAMD